MRARCGRERPSRAAARGAALALVLLAAVAGGGAHASGGRPPPPALPEAAAVTLLPPRPLAQRRHGYGWPLRPFDRQHPIRGGFGDPRFGELERHFHFGIDIPAPAGTPVYAVAAGTAYLAPDRVAVLTSASRRHATGFSYWHVIPSVAEHAFVPRHGLIGWVNPAWGHLHFAELADGRWQNPLRPGALTPVSQPLKPTIESLLVAPTAAGSQTPEGLQGTIAVVVDAYARSPVEPPPPWQQARLAPTLIRWRLLTANGAPTRWRDVVDFRDYIPPGCLFHDVYAPGTTPNTPNHPGSYLYYLARSWDLDTLPAGQYTIQAQAFGSTQNTIATANTPLQVAPHPPRAEIKKKTTSGPR